MLVSYLTTFYPGDIQVAWNGVLVHFDWSELLLRRQYYYMHHERHHGKECD